MKVLLFVLCFVFSFVWAKAREHSKFCVSTFLEFNYIIQSLREVNR